MTHDQEAALNQKTLRQAVQATGVGLHSGEKVLLTLRPAPVDTGIVFNRTDLDIPCAIPAHADFVGDTILATTLCKDGYEIATVEHLMSAFSGLGVDNAYVDVAAAEVPIMDGSAAPFVFLLQSAGLVEQSARKTFLRILKPVEYRSGDTVARLEPYDGFRLEYTLRYDHPVFARHRTTATVDFSNSTFVREVSRARTFGFLADYERLRAMDLAKGGSLDNAVVVDDYQILNTDGLRLEDEFAKHKILDAIGDLYLLGHSIIGQFFGYKSGHGTNNALVRQLLTQQDCYELLSYSDVDAPPAAYQGAPLAV